MAQLDDLIRGQIAVYGNIRGQGTIKPQKTGAQLGHGNIGGMRNRGKPAFPTGYNLAPKANDNGDEGFQVQSEPIEEGGDLSVVENRWLRGLAAAGSLAVTSPTGEVPPPYVGMGDVARAGGKDIPMTTDDHINDAAEATGVQPEFLRAIMSVESTGDTNAVSHRGARGMMQLMPGTAAAVGVKDPHDPKQNIMGGARYIQMLANTYRGDLIKVIAAYNAGPNAISGKKRSEMPRETQDHLRRVLRKLPKGFKTVSYKPLTKKQFRQWASLGSEPRLAMSNEGRGAGISHGNTDLSGRQERAPGLDDAEDRNRLPNDPIPLRGLHELIGALIIRRLDEDRATQVGVTGGSFQPFHRGHSAVVRKLAAVLPKIVIFVEPGRPFGQQTISALMRASLSDIWDKIEIYPAQGDLQTSAQRLAGSPGTTLNAESAVTFHPMPEDDEISSKRINDALQDDERDMVRKMLDPLVSTEPAVFEQLYAQMRRELGRSGKKPVEVVTDAPVAAPQPEAMNELGAGAMDGAPGTMRGGAHGHSAWSGYNPRGNFEDRDDDDIPNAPTKVAPGAGSEQYQQMLRSPSTRMLNMTNHGTPNDHMPGDFDQHLDRDDEQAPGTLNDPTDLTEMIISRLKNTM